MKRSLLQPPAPGKDYYGGPIKIVGEPYDEATPTEPQDVKASGAPIFFRRDRPN